MSLSQPIERVVSLLGEAGFEALPQPVTVAGIPFQFGAVLSARTSLDLVVVVDTALDRDAASVLRRVEGISRALDLVESRRPVTVIVVGPTPDQGLQTGMSRVARVLPVGTPSDENDLRERIAVLLPLDLAVAGTLPESWSRARSKLSTEHPDAAALIKAAPRGADAVSEAVRKKLLSRLAGE